MRGLSLVVWALRHARSLLLMHKGPVPSCSLSVMKACSETSWFLLIPAAYLGPNHLLSYGTALESDYLDVNPWSSVYWL